MVWRTVLFLGQSQPHRPKVFKAAMSCLAAAVPGAAAVHHERHGTGARRWRPKRMISADVVVHHKQGRTSDISPIPQQLGDPKADWQSGKIIVVVIIIIIIIISESPVQVRKRRLSVIFSQTT